MVQGDTFNINNNMKAGTWLKEKWRNKKGDLLRSTQSGFSSFWNETDLDLAPFGMKHDIVPKYFHTFLVKFLNVIYCILSPCRKSVI